MSKNLKLFTVGNFEFRLQHLLIIVILSLAFSISMLIRSQGADYGFELNEFDPFFNYRATEFIVNNGLTEYFDWHDDRSWYPYGRNVSETSQVMLHVTAATLYPVFGMGADLYDFTIMFPVVFGSLSVIVIFALVRVFAGTTSGLFASLFFAISLPIILRSGLGWFKSEPLGIFFVLIALYLFFSGIKHNKGKISFVKIIVGALFFAFALSAWGGTQFFILPLGLFFFALPFLRDDHRFIIWAIPLFSFTLVLLTLFYERPSTSFVLGYGGVILILPTIFLIISCIIKKTSPIEKQLRNLLIFLGSIIVTGTALIFSGIAPLPTFRYLNAINPFLLAQDALTDSVSEHMTTNIETSFQFLSVFMILAGIGVWFIFNNFINKNNQKTFRNDMLVFVLLVGILGAYISSAFIRLELFASISVIILSSIGLSILLKHIFNTKIKNSAKTLIKISSIFVVIFLLVIPLVLPEHSNWIDYAKYQPTILNGGSSYAVVHVDWPHALNWIKSNTPYDSVFFSWWDYGYWITTIGDRISLADNATLIDHQIERIGYVFFKNADDAWLQLSKPHSAILRDDGLLGGPEMLDEEQRKEIENVLIAKGHSDDDIAERIKELEIQTRNEVAGFGADYVLIFLAGMKLTGPNAASYYILEGGGDESKKEWFMKIAGVDRNKFLESDGHTPKDAYWNTLLGKMTPFRIAGYANPATDQIYSEYQHGLVPVYTTEIKYPKNGDGPFRLVYASPSIDRTEKGPFTVVLIYEVNKNYKN